MNDEKYELCDFYGGINRTDVGVRTGKVEGENLMPAIDS